jgi:hypothetical protein
VSSESIASPPLPVGAPEQCRGCGAPLADDQRYCLECGERRTPMSSVLLGAAPGSSAAPQGPPSAPPAPSIPPGRPGDAEARGSAATVIAGVGVLLLAMGVGVLIGRSGGAKTAPAPPAQVITVAGTGGTSTGAAETATLSDDWPSGTSGYTVQLQTLPVAGTLPSAVEAAKTAASGKGAKEVGALKSEDFSSLTAGDYVIYSGVYHKRAEAQKALGGLKRSFAGATVVKVSDGAGASSPAGGSGSGATPPAGGSGGKVDLKHPAPPSAAEGESKAKGKSYEEKSKNLPDVISTG